MELVCELPDGGEVGRTSLSRLQNLIPFRVKEMGRHSHSVVEVGFVPFEDGVQREL